MIELLSAAHELFTIGWVSRCLKGHLGSTWKIGWRFNYGSLAQHLKRHILLKPRPILGMVSYTRSNGNPTSRKRTRHLNKAVGPTTSMTSNRSLLTFPHANRRGPRCNLRDQFHFSMWINATHAQKRQQFHHTQF